MLLMALVHGELSGASVASLMFSGACATSGPDTAIAAIASPTTNRNGVLAGI
jgi:hypothetical protein